MKIHTDGWKGGGVVISIVFAVVIIGCEWLGDQSAVEPSERRSVGPLKRGMAPEISRAGLEAISN